MTNRQWTTGPTVEATAEMQIAGEKRFQEVMRIAELSGDHVWTAITQYLITDPLKPLFLDSESICGVPVIGCYRCEEEYSPRLASRRCKKTAKWKKVE